MRKLQVTKNETYLEKIGGGTIANIGEVNLLINGAIAIFGSAGTMIIDGATAAAAIVASTGEQAGYTVFVGADITNDDSFPVKSPVIPYGSKVSKSTYIAPTKEEKTIGDSGAGGAYNNPALVAGQKAHIRIQDLSNGTLPAVEIFRFEELVVTGDSMATIMARMVTKINAHPTASLLVTAAATSAGIGAGMLLSVQKNNTTIDVGLDGILSDATLTVNGTGDSTVIIYSSGDSDSIQELYDDYKAELGDTSGYCLPQLFTRDNPVVAGETYIVYNISWTKSRGNSIGTDVGITRQRQEIAVPSGAAALIVVLDIIFAALD